MVMMALVAAGTLNSSAAYLSTAVKGASSGTLSLRSGRRSSDDVSDREEVPRGFPPGAIRRARGVRRGTPTPGRGTHTRKGSLGSEVSVILKETFDMVAVVRGQRVLLYRRGL